MAKIPAATSRSWAPAGDVRATVRDYLEPPASASLAAPSDVAVDSAGNVYIVDRRNHHLFQPLLYQVATGILSQGEIAPSTREILSRQDNAKVLLGEVVEGDFGGRTFDVRPTLATVGEVLTSLIALTLLLVLVFGLLSGFLLYRVWDRGTPAVDPRLRVPTGAPGGERLSAWRLRHHLRRQRDVGCDHNICRFDMLHNIAIGNIAARLHAQR